MSDPVLAVEGLTAGFDGIPAVRNVSFSVAAGETLCIVGESGSGKSVTALAIIRLVPPPGRISAGAIRFEGRDLAMASREELQRVRGDRIGFVFQEPMTALNPVMTIGAQIEETLRVHGKATRQTAAARAVELLAMVSVPEPARRTGEYAHQLSGGLRQRALIAMALACGPKLLIADEPTTALDVTVQAQILGLMQELSREQGMAMILVSHDLDVVGDVCEDVVVMKDGVVVEAGHVDDVLSHPKHAYTMQLLNARPSFGAGHTQAGAAHG